MRILVLVIALSGCVDGELDVPKKGASAHCCRILDTDASADCVWREVPYKAPLYGEPWVDEDEVCRNAGYRPPGEPE